MNPELIAQLINIDGKKITQPERNLLTKLFTDYNVRFENQLSDSIVNSLVYFVRGCNTGWGPVTYRGKKVPVSLFDRTRYFILKLDSKAYSNYID